MLHHIILLVLSFTQLIQGMGCSPETIAHTPSGVKHHPIPLSELNDYVVQYGCGRKSLCPTRIEGQAILQFLSFPAGEKHRLAYVAGILIFFSFTRFIQQGKLYHAHYRLDGTDGLASSARDALRDNGIINGKGKFIK